LEVKVSRNSKTRDVKLGTKEWKEWKRSVGGDFASLKSLHDQAGLVDLSSCRLNFRSSRRQLNAPF